MPDTTPHAIDLLTPRERQMLHLLAEGLTAEEIASRLDVHVATVKAHRSRIMRKLGLSSTSELVRVALREAMPG